MFTHNKDRYPYTWKLPPKPWPHENGDQEEETDNQWTKTAQKANTIQNNIRHLERLTAKTVEKKERKVNEKNG